MTEYERYINILKCAFTGQTPSKEPLDMEALWHFSGKHAIRPVIASVLIGNDMVSDDEWKQVWRETMLKNVRKTLAFDVERKRIFQALEDNDIRYVPLKGIIVNRFYPVYGTRDFSDNDILVDPGAIERVEQAVKPLSYTFEPTAIMVHYTFHREPFYSFEFHFRLFNDNEKFKAFNTYFNRLASDLMAQPSSSCAREMSREDHCVYLMAHAYKHYVKSGLGLKTPADIYAAFSKLQPDAEAVSKKLNELGILQFARSLEGVARKIFGGTNEFCLSDLNEDERFLLDEVLRVGGKGNADEYYSKEYLDYVEKSGSNSRLGYYKSRLFPDMEAYRKKFPVFYKHKTLHPLFYIYRPIRGIFVNGKGLRHELKSVSKTKKQKKKE